MVEYIDVGAIDFREAWDYQEKLFNTIIDVKINNRKRSVDSQHRTPNYLIFCCHPHVYTLGKSGDIKNLLVTDDELKKGQISFYHTNRGGDITYHGPGQIVAYPIFDLENFFTDIHKYLRCLEETVILTLAELGVKAGRLKGLTGVWLDPDNNIKSRKICALGVKTSRWVAMHGLAFNVTSDLNYFNKIVPCGIKNRAVTSLQNELSYPVDIEAIKTILKDNFQKVFDIEYKNTTDSI